jgi:hypothetical protein
MKIQLITCEQALSFFTQSEDRKNDIRKSVNDLIERRAKEGHGFAHLTELEGITMCSKEIQFIYDELTMCGFNCNQYAATVSWVK